MRKRNNNNGFTLLEMIIAISLLALVAVLGWRSLDAMVRTRYALNDKMAETHDIQLTFAQLQHDCAQLAPSDLARSRPTLHADANRLVLLRLVELDRQPTQLQVVSYVLREGTLTRTATLPTRDLATLDLLWQSAVGGGSSNVLPPVVLQTGLTSMRLRLWSPNSPGWRAQNAAQSGSQWTGVEMSITRSGQQGSLIKSFLLGSAA